LLSPILTLPENWFEMTTFDGIDKFQALLLTSPLVSIVPFICCGLCYFYHFTFRKTQKRLRKEEDSPIEEHQSDWQTSLFRPEASCIVAVYGLTTGLVFSYFDLDYLLPTESALKFDLQIYPLRLFLLFFVLDFSMYCVHYAQHFNRWLYHKTHAHHHKIRSPTILVALTGHFPDTFLLVLLPLHFTYCVVPCNALTLALFSFLSMVHLHCIHSEFVNPWDDYLHFFGLVNTYDHHVHHLRPQRNLAHFFTGIDKVFGTYTDPKSVKELLFHVKTA